MIDTLLHSLTAVAIVMAMVAVGYFFAKRGYIRHEHKKLMVKLIISAGMPALVMSNVLGSLDLSAMENPLLLFGLPVCCMLITLAMGFLLSKLMKPPLVKRGGFIVMCAFSNSVFVGLPMNTGLFGDAAVPYVMVFYIVNTTLFWTIGNYLINKSGAYSKEGEALPGKRRFITSVKRLLSPPLIALAVAIPLLILEYELKSSAAFMEQFANSPVTPYFLLLKQSFLKLCGYMGNIVTPLALLYVGATLHEYGFKSLKPDRFMWAAIAVRFVIAPAVMLALCYAVGFGGVGAGVFTVEAAMPVMTQAVVLAASCDADESFVSAGMCATTLGCFVLVPILMLALTAAGLV